MERLKRLLLESQGWSSAWNSARVRDVDETFNSRANRQMCRFAYTARKMHGDNLISQQADDIEQGKQTTLKKGKPTTWQDSDWIAGAWGGKKDGESNKNLADLTTRPIYKTDKKTGTKSVDQGHMTRHLGNYEPSDKDAEELTGEVDKDKYWIAKDGTKIYSAKTRKTDKKVGRLKIVHKVGSQTLPHKINPHITKKSIEDGDTYSDHNKKQLNAAKEAEKSGTDTSKWWRSGGSTPRLKAKIDAYQDKDAAYFKKYPGRKAALFQKYKKYAGLVEFFCLNEFLELDDDDTEAKLDIVHGVKMRGKNKEIYKQQLKNAERQASGKAPLPTTIKKKIGRGYGKYKVTDSSGAYTTDADGNKIYVGDDSNKAKDRTEYDPNDARNIAHQKAKEAEKQQKQAQPKEQPKTSHHDPEAYINPTRGWQDKIASIYDTAKKRQGVDDDEDVELTPEEQKAVNAIRQKINSLSKVAEFFLGKDTQMINESSDAPWKSRDKLNPNVHHPNMSGLLSDLRTVLRKQAKPDSEVLGKSTPSKFGGNYSKSSLFGNTSVVRTKNNFNDRLMAMQKDPNGDGKTKTIRQRPLTTTN